MTDINNPPVLLPTDLEAEFAETALRVFRTAQQRSCATTDTNTIGNLMLSMLDCVKSALLPDLRAHNAAQVARAGLPHELWCLIWGHLSMEDRVRVTHVCSAWRELAVGTPRLWCSLDFFSSRHDGDCDCDRCRFLQDEDAICDRCDDDLLIGRSNIVLVIALLPRSQQLPLHLRVDAPHSSTDGDVLDELAVALLAHAHRLELISIDSEDENTVLCLFNGLGPTLPALRVLDCKTACFPTLLEALPATLPCLQTVNLRDGWGHFEDEAVVPSFPSVHTVHFQLIYQKDLDSYLNAFPSVQHLHVSLASEDAMRTASAVPLSGRTNARSLSSVHVYDVSPTYEDAVLALFYDVRLPLLVLVYDPPSEDDSDSECPSPCRGLDIFVDLSRPTMLHCSAMDSKIAFLSAEGDGKRREIRISSSVVGLLWRSLSTTHLSTVRIDASLFFDLFSRSVAPEFPALRLFEVALKGSDDFLDVLGEDILRPISFISAPSLDTLRIHSPDSTSYANINASHIALFANLLRGGRVLRTLSLRHVLVTGDAQELSSIANTVEYGVHGGTSG